MSEQFRTLSEYLEKAGHAQGAQLTRNFGDSLLEAGLIPETVNMEEPVKTDRSVIGNKLDKIAKEFNSQVHTPEVLSQTFQAIWQARGELVGATYEVAACTYTQEKIAELEANGKRIGYLPPELATQKTRHILGGIAPEMQSHSVKENNSVTNDENYDGWFDYEIAVVAPYPDTTEKKLKEDVKKDDRRLLTLNEYIAASLDNKLFTGHYLDEYRPNEFSTRVRLASRNDGR